MSDPNMWQQFIKEQLAELLPVVGQAIADQLNVSAVAAATALNEEQLRIQARDVAVRERAQDVADSEVASWAERRRENYHANLLLSALVSLIRSGTSTAEAMALAQTAADGIYPPPRQ